jgi:hypothetical protein
MLNFIKKKNHKPYLVFNEALEFFQQLTQKVKNVPYFFSC